MARSLTARHCRFMARLRDILAEQLDVVFCGMAAGATSAARGHYYAGPGNKFWRLLFSTRLTPHLLQPDQDSRVIEWGVGLTDLNKKDAGADSTLAKANFDIDAFIGRMAAHRPKRVAFNGKAAAKKVFGAKLPKGSWGKQSWKIADSEVWMLPSTSGAANGSWDERPWIALARSVIAERGFAGRDGLR